MQLLLDEIEKFLYVVDITFILTLNFSCVLS